LKEAGCDIRFSKIPTTLEKSLLLSPERRVIGFPQAAARLYLSRRAEAPVESKPIVRIDSSFPLTLDGPKLS